MKKLKRFIIPLFIPHAGCRHHCIFCDQHAVTGSDPSPVTQKKVRDIVSRYCETSPYWTGERELAYYGGSFTALPEKRQEELLDVGRELIDAGLIQALRISTRPDAIDNETLNRLIYFGVRTVEIGVQSTSDDVLIRAKRGHTVNDTINAAGLLSSRNMAWIAQIMPGLPGDTFETMIQTAIQTADLHPSGVRIYPALVISGTQMERMYRTGKYTPLAHEHAVEVIKRIVMVFESRRIPILRIGLHPSGDLERHIIAGPYHPAFGSLVHESRLLDAMIAAIQKTGDVHNTTVFRIHPGDISCAIGNKRSTINRLKQRYPGMNFEIIPDGSIRRGEVHADGI